MVRFTKCLVAVVALGFVVGSACKKADNAAGGGGGASDDVSLIPADSELVMGLNFAQLQQSGLWKQYGAAMMAKSSDKLDKFKTACGFDPVTSFKSMVIGVKNMKMSGGDTPPDGVVVVHGPDKAKVMACIDKYKAEAAKEGTEVSTDGDVVMIKDNKGQTYAMTFANDTTIVATMGALGTKDGVKAAAKGGNGLKSSQMFNDLFSKINTNDSLWVMVNGNSPLMDKASMLGKPKAMYGSLNITDGLAVDFHVKSATADEAKSLVDMAKAQTDSPQVKQMVDKMDISANGDDAHFVVALGAEKLKQIAGMFGGLLGGMRGPDSGAAPQ